MKLEELNPEQLKAVNHIKRPLLVLAGAGLGAYFFSRMEAD